jgi:hypothetical protein
MNKEIAPFGAFLTSRRRNFRGKFTPEYKMVIKFLKL